MSEIKRPTRKASETVMNAKFGLLFQSEFTVNEGPLYVSVYNKRKQLRLCLHQTVLSPRVVHFKCRNARETDIES